MTSAVWRWPTGAKRRRIPLRSGGGAGLAGPARPGHAVVDVRVAGRALESPEIALALVMVSLFAAVAVLSWLPFLIAGYDPLDAPFEVVSALGTVGLSSGVSGMELPPLLKGVLCLDMLAGRLDILAFLVLFFPPTWRARPAAPRPAPPGRAGAAGTPPPPRGNIEWRMLTNLHGFCTFVGVFASVQTPLFWFFRESFFFA